MYNCTTTFPTRPQPGPNTVQYENQMLSNFLQPHQTQPNPLRTQAVSPGSTPARLPWLILGFAPDQPWLGSGLAPPALPRIGLGSALARPELSLDSAPPSQPQLDSPGSAPLTLPWLGSPRLSLDLALAWPPLSPGSNVARINFMGFLPILVSD